MHADLVAVVGMMPAFKAAKAMKDAVEYSWGKIYHKEEESMPSKKIADVAADVKNVGRKAKAKVEEAVGKAADTAAATEVEVKKAARAAGRKAKAAVDQAASDTREAMDKAVADAREVTDAAAAQAADDATAAVIGTQKKARATSQKARAAVTDAVGKAVGAVKDAAEKARIAAEIEAGKAKAKLTRKAAEAKEAVTEAAAKPVRKARAVKLDIVIQSVMGGAITPEEIAAKLPKDAITAYVKVEENKIYWVNKAGETGDVKIWG